MVQNHWLSSPTILFRVGKVRSRLGNALLFDVVGSVAAWTNVWAQHNTYQQASEASTPNLPDRAVKRRNLSNQSTNTGTLRAGRRGPGSFVLSLFLIAWRWVFGFSQVSVVWAWMMEVLVYCAHHPIAICGGSGLQGGMVWVPCSGFSSFMFSTSRRIPVLENALQQCWWCFV